MEKNKNTKEEKYFLVLDSVLRLDFTKGHLKWSISDVARKAKVTRSLIYYYFGNDKYKMIVEAANFLAERLFKLDIPNENRGDIKSRMNVLVKLLNENPHYLVSYYLNRKQDNELGGRIRAVEKKFFSKLSEEFPKLDAKQLKLIYIIELGACLFQDIDSDYMKWTEEILHKVFKPS